MDMSALADFAVLARLCRRASGPVLDVLARQSRKIVQDRNRCAVGRLTLMEEGEGAQLRIAADLDGLELIEAVHRRPRFARHAHPTYALGVVRWGANRFRYRGAFHTAAAGTLCTVTPDEVHSVEPAGDLGFAYRCIYPSVALLGAAAEALGGKRLTRTLALPPVIDDAKAARLLHSLFEAEDGTPRLAREGRLLALLARVVARHAMRPVALRVRVPPAAAIARARDYLAAHCSENVALARLAAVAQLEPFALLRGFARAYGLPPHSWQLQERVRLAQALLRAGVAPAEVAAAAGFSDQSHLNRHFKRLLGFTPGRYGHAQRAAREAGAQVENALALRHPRWEAGGD
jgi:AraC-like DNA-binding protein